MDEPSSNPQKPNLFTLPRELRDLIYEFACEGCTASIKSTTANTNDGTPVDPNVALTTSNSNVSILQVCRQIRHEVEPIYYRRTIFTFSSADACVAWLRRHVPRQILPNLRHVRVEDARSYETLERLKQTLERSPKQTLLDKGYGDLLALHACLIQKQAEFTLKRALVGLIDEGFKLRPSALQVAVLGNEDCEMMWTATPAEAEMPFREYMP